MSQRKSDIGLRIPRRQQMVVGHFNDCAERSLQARACVTTKGDVGDPGKKRPDRRLQTVEPGGSCEIWLGAALIACALPNGDFYVDNRHWEA